MRATVGLILGLALYAAPCHGAGEDAKGELERLAGEWRIVSTDSGEGPTALDGFTMVISQDGIVLRAPGGTRKMGAIGRVDPTAEPKQIDLKKDGDKGLGIYELGQNTLKLLVRDPGEGRAKEFKGSDKGMLFILKRETK